MSIARATAFLINGIELRLMVQSPQRRERMHPGGRNRPVNCVNVALNGETLAALGTASGEHLTSAAGRHASTESVRAFAMQVTRLIRALHVSFRLERGTKRYVGPPKMRGGRVRIEYLSVKRIARRGSDEIVAFSLWITRSMSV
jgi:hypothetical protein